MIDYENVEMAQDNDVPFTNPPVCATPGSAGSDLVQTEGVNTKFARAETIKKFRLIDQFGSGRRGTDTDYEAEAQGR